MKLLSLRRVITGTAILAAAVACTPSRPRTEPAPCCSAEAMQIAERYRVAAIDERRFTHAELWGAMAPALRSPAVRVTEIGRSMQGRPIRAVTVGTGPTTVLLWSQMHGDEATATMSLADMTAWFADTSSRDALRTRLASELTIVMVPMLNPDGAELFQRENAVGIDVNRDARRLVTPEARALKYVRDSIDADFGFNLHDQNARTLTGSRGRQVAIALLAPAADAARSWTPGRTRARHVAAVVARSLEPYLIGRIAAYDDTFEPRAFGDLMQQWGTSTVLIESGAMEGDPEKQQLRALTVVAIVSALDAIATGAYADQPTAPYDDLSTNSRSALDVLVRGGSLVIPGRDPIRADITLNYDEPVRRHDPRIRDVGDLASAVALDTIEAAGLFIHLAPAPGEAASANRPVWLHVGMPAAFTIRRSADPASEVVRTIGER